MKLKLVEDDKQYLAEMALSRSDAIDKCMSNGNKFIEHFKKLYQEPNAQVVNHWCNEMQGWYNEIKGLKFKYNNKTLLDENIRDWFFTIGKNTEDFLSNPEEIEFYDKFCSYLLVYNNVHQAFAQIKELLQKDESDSL